MYAGKLHSGVMGVQRVPPRVAMAAWADRRDNQQGEVSSGCSRKGALEKMGMLRVWDQESRSHGGFQHCLRRLAMHTFFQKH